VHPICPRIALVDSDGGLRLGTCLGNHRLQIVPPHCAAQ
jgi:hypothetical protein